VDYCDKIEAGNLRESLGPVAKLRTFCVWVGRSSSRSQKYKEHCTAYRKPARIPEYDIQTRWNSTFRMIEQSLDSKDQIATFTKITDEIYDLVLSESEWVFLAKLKTVLKIFSTMTQKMSEALPVLWRSLPLYYILDDRINAITTKSGKFCDLPDVIVEGVQKGYDKFKKYYEKMDAEVTYFIGLILDPRMKADYLHLHLGKVNADLVTAEAKEVYSTHYRPGPSDETETQDVQIHDDDDDINWLMFSELHKAHREDDEWERYLSSPIERPVGLDTDIEHAEWVLTWWRNHKSTYPNLSIMARDYLGIPGASVSVERIFNGGRDLLGLRRHSMSAESMRILMVLRNGYMNHEIS
jgi:hypothetical protein